VAGFPGFSDFQQRLVPLPQEFFDRLLPGMHNLLELKLVLHVCSLLASQRGPRRSLSLRELLANDLLLKSLKQEGNPRAPVDNLRDAIERALARGVLLSVTMRGDGESDVWLFLNSPTGRAAIAGLQREQAERTQAGMVPATVVTVDRPNLFLLYEQNIGLLTPIVAELIRDAVAEYPEEWIRDAMGVSAAANRRNWRFVERVLERWAREGKDDGTIGQLSEGSGEATAGRRSTYERFVQS